VSMQSTEPVTRAVETGSAASPDPGPRSDRPLPTGPLPPPPIAVIRRRPRPEEAPGQDAGEEERRDPILDPRNASRAVRSAIDRVLDDLAEGRDPGKR
jgi:hypothetical protein